MLAVVGEKGLAGGALERRSGASRQRLLMRVAKLICSSGEYPCVMLDVSDSGTKVRLFDGHPPDTYMFIELANGAVYPVERRWKRQDCAGFRFTSPVDVASFVSEANPHARRPVRLRTQREVQFVAAGERGHAILINLSARGACIEAGRQIPLASPLRIELPGLPVRFAHVCWRTNYRHGLAFQEDMTMADFARLANALHPFQPTAAWHKHSDVAQPISA